MSEIEGQEKLEAVLDDFIQALSPAAQRQLLTRVTRRMASENRKRIAANVTPEGQPFAPRKRPKKTRAGSRPSLLMFKKLKMAKWLKAKTSPDGGSVFFAGGAAGIAKIHHYGMSQVVGKNKPRLMTIPARPLLGLSANDLSLIEDAILDSFAKIA
jgi:phage virion morphogenesis protein